MLCLYVAVHGQQRVDADEDVELERAPRRGKKNCTLEQEQAEEAPAPAGGRREPKNRRIHVDFEVASRSAITRRNERIWDSRVPASSHSRYQHLWYLLTL